MSDLYREKTTSVTQQYSRRLKKATLQSGTHLAESQGRAPKGKGSRPAASTNEVQCRGSCLHRR